jgi:hypothetical protein
MVRLEVLDQVLIYKDIGINNLIVNFETKLEAVSRSFCRKGHDTAISKHD